MEKETPVQEKFVPEINLIEKFDRLFCAVKAVTHPSRFGRSEDVPEGMERSLLSRKIRAELLRKLESIPKNDREARKKVLDEAHIRDEIAKQYLRQGEITIDLPGLGGQTARYVEIVPPNTLKTLGTESKPPIFLIPGISNDIDSVGALLQEIAFYGRRVITVAFPESHMGRVTPSFALAARKSSDYEPHVSFYKQVIKTFFGENSKLELWGFSAGAPVSAQILTDPEFQKRTTDAVFLCPGSSVNQTKRELYSGLVSEIVGFSRRFGKLAKLSVTHGRKTPEEVGQRELKKQIFNSLLEKVCRRFDFWKQAKVEAGGKIIVVSGRKDQITTSSKAIKKFLQNPQITILDLPSGSHATPLIEPHAILGMVFENQDLTKTEDLFHT